VSYKRRNIVLSIVVLLFCWISWNIAIQETVLLKKDLNQARTTLDQVKDAPLRIKILEKKLEQVKGSSNRFYSGILEMRQALLSEVTLLIEKYDLSLKRFPDYFLHENEGIELTTSPIVLTGAFLDMLRFIDEFEKKNFNGKISATTFEIEESPRTKKRTLYLTIYVQSINQ